MPSFSVQTSQCRYCCVVERGIAGRLAEFVPPRTTRVFAVSTLDVLAHHGHLLPPGTEVLIFPGREANKRLSVLEGLAEQMVQRGADRHSLMIGFGGGIVTDVAGFLAAIFMRGIPVLQVPTTLLAQVDAAIGGKTGVNLAVGKNLIGSFHQPIAVLVDPDLLATLPAREYRAGLFEVIKCSVIRDPELFQAFEESRTAILEQSPELVDFLISAAVRIKAEVVSADEKEGDLRRILNFGHTVGHALEAETHYEHFLHGEAIAWGMLAATRLAVLTGNLPTSEAERIRRVVCAYGPLPTANHLDPDHILDRLGSDKKTQAGTVHFVLPTAIGTVKIVPAIPHPLIRQAIVESLQ